MQGSCQEFWALNSTTLARRTVPIKAEEEQGTAFVALLRACTKNKDLFGGSRLHQDILRKGFLQECSDALVTMYAKCGALRKAKELFDQHKSRDIFTWTAMIGGYVHMGQGQNALDCFEKMQHQGLSPDAVTYSCILKACGCIKAADKGEEIHDEIAQRGLLANNIVLGNALVDMHVKCGSLSKARQVLEELPARDVISWNALIVGYAEHGQYEQVMDCFGRMQQEGLSPDAVTFFSILRACGCIGVIEKGEKIHDEITKCGLLRKNILLGNALIDMYVKCGALSKAEQVLKELPDRDVVSWSTLITGYTEHGQAKQALKCFEQMQYEGISPDLVTFSCILKACGSVGAADKGEKIHNDISELGLLHGHTVLGSALVDMYAKCGALLKAHQVLQKLPHPNSIAYNALIVGYAEHGKAEDALKCLEQMLHEGIPPNAVTYTCVLKACASIGAADKGQKVHDAIAKQGLLQNDLVLGNALVAMYAKSGALTKAWQVLKELPVRDVISWTTLIASYADHAEGEKALDCFEQMRQEHIAPNAVTFICILKACASIGAADKGEEFHDEMRNQGLLQSDVVLGTALVDMYVKCGSLAKARQVLKELPIRSVTCWNALIAGYAEDSTCVQVLNCFKEMQDEGLSPDAATFSSVLSACSHVGLVEDAQTHFWNMSTKYGLRPNLEHYTCMVDLLGRIGHLQEAVGMLKQVPCCSVAVWSALLSACQQWGDVEVGTWAFQQAVQIDESDSAIYALMANIYAGAGMQKDAERIEAMRIENKAHI